MGRKLLKKKDFHVPYLHTECGKVAFYCKKVMEKGDVMSSKLFMMINGQHPKPYTQMMCGSCKKPIHQPIAEYLKVVS